MKIIQKVNGINKTHGIYVTIAKKLFAAVGMGIKGGKEYNKKVRTVTKKAYALKKNCKRGTIESDSLLRSMDIKLNPRLTSSDSNFDQVKEDSVDALIHVTRMHPKDLFDNVIKPMFNLEIATRVLIDHYRASMRISKFNFASASMVRATSFHFFHDQRDLYY